MPRIDAPASPLVPRLRGLHLFHFDAAPCAQRVRFALGEKGFRRGAEVPWRSDAPAHCEAAPGTWTSRVVSLVKKEHLTPEYAALHPGLVVPALVHDGVLWTESMDVIRTLDGLSDRGRLVPAQPEAAAEMDALVAKARALHPSLRHVSFRWGLGRLGRLGRKEEERLLALERADSPEGLAAFYTRYDRGQIEEATYRAHLARLESAFADLEKRLAADTRPFLLGPDFTTADIPWSIKVLRLHECGYPFARRYPALWAWYQRVASRPAFRESVLGQHRAMHAAFRVKARVEAWLGGGIGRVAGVA